MAPHSSNIICDSKRTVNDSISRNFDDIEEKPTNLVEVVSHFPKDVFEKRPFRASMGAIQVHTITFKRFIRGLNQVIKNSIEGILN